MDYECVLFSADKLLFGPGGDKPPLCNDCKAIDCSNPIKEVSVSIMGIEHKYRFWVVNNVVKQVIACQGYIGDQHVPVGLSSDT